MDESLGLGRNTWFVSLASKVPFSSFAGIRKRSALGFSMEANDRAMISDFTQMQSSTVSARRQVLDCENRDHQLWFIVIVTLGAVGVGFAVLFLPNLLWGFESSDGRSPYLPQLLYGFVVLIILLNIYVIRQRRTLRQLRVALMEELVRAEKALAASFIDPLTELFNRRYLDYLGRREAKRADRAASVFSLLIADLDNFKTVNDRFGHIEGDRCLQQFAGILRQVFRETDTVIRYGGDEFLVLMTDTSEQNAEIAAQRVVDAIVSWKAGNRSVESIGLSYGIACYATGESIDTVIQRADQRMYHQKSGSREPASA